MRRRWVVISSLFSRSPFRLKKTLFWESTRTKKFLGRTVISEFISSCFVQLKTYFAFILWRSISELLRKMKISEVASSAKKLVAVYVHPVIMVVRILTLGYLKRRMMRMTVESFKQLAWLWQNFKSRCYILKQRFPAYKSLTRKRDKQRENKNAGVDRINKEVA